MAAHNQITAIIYDRKGRVLAVGQNSYVKTHPMQALHARKVGNVDKIYLHAEIHAITRCKNIDQAHRISVFRYDSKNKPVLAKPCSICISAIGSTSIKHIEHT